MDKIKMPEMNKKTITISIVIAVVILIIVFGKNIMAIFQGIANPIEGLLGTDPATQQAKQTVTSADQSATSPNSPWNPALYNSNPDASTLDYDTLISMAAAIKGAVSTWIPNILSAPDGSAIFSAIKQCNNQYDVSNLAIVFNQQYNTDLYTFISQNLQSIIGLGDNDNVVILSQIDQYVSQLPLS